MAEAAAPIAKRFATLFIVSSFPKPLAWTIAKQCIVNPALTAKLCAYPIPGAVPCPFFDKDRHTGFENRYDIKFGARPRPQVRGSRDTATLQAVQTRRDRRFGNRRARQS